MGTAVVNAINNSPIQQFNNSAISLPLAALFCQTALAKDVDTN